MTPSHHRVHHAINPLYIDKNYAQIFIIWDMIFGTFQPELKEEPPVYGVKKAVKTWNPFLINFQHFWLLVRDAWRTRNWWDKLRIWFMPTGWRPEDVKINYPVEIIEDVHAQKKYDTPATNALKGWSWIQLIIHIVLMLYLFNNIGDLSLSEMLLYGLFLGVSIFSYTALMDNSKLAVGAEIVKIGLGSSLIYALNGWYGIDQMVTFGTPLIVFYLFISLLITLYFSFSNKEMNLSFQ